MKTVSGILHITKKEKRNIEFLLEHAISDIYLTEEKEIKDIKEAIENIYSIIENIAIVQ